MKQKFVKVVLRHLQKENDFGCICGHKLSSHRYLEPHSCLALNCNCTNRTKESK